MSDNRALLFAWMGAAIVFCFAVGLLQAANPPTATPSVDKGYAQVPVPGNPATQPPPTGNAGGSPVPIQTSTEVWTRNPFTGQWHKDP